MPNSADRRRHDLLAAFRYALEGLVEAWRSQPNVRIHTAIVVVVVAAGILVRLAPLEWALVAGAISLVMVAELLNTAIEAVVDLVSPDEHPLAKHAKDVAAGAVLLAAGGSVAIGVCVLIAVLRR